MITIRVLMVQVCNTHQALSLLVSICRLKFGSVCKQLYAVVRESSPLWHDIRFKWADSVLDAASPTFHVRRAAFVQHRISAVRTVHIGPMW